MYSEPYAVLDYEPRIDWANGIWVLALELRYLYKSSDQFFDELVKFDSIKKCLEFMLQKGFAERLGLQVSNHGEKVADSLGRQLFQRVLAPLADTYIRRFGCVFDYKNFKVLYREFVEYAYSDERKTIFVYPLENFELRGLDEVTVGGFRIRRLSEWEVKQLIRLGQAHALGSTHGLDMGTLENRWCIEAVATVPRGSVVEEPPVDDLVHVLRLFKKGTVRTTSRLIILDVLGGFFVGASTKSPHIYAVTTRKPQIYILQQNDVPSLITLWNLYKHVKDVLPRELRTALRWFNKSYEEPDVEDRVLDLAIAFEAMFGRRDYEVLAPRLLASNFNERKKIAEYLKELKNARNSIAHGGHSRFSEDELEAIAANAEEIFRRCYRRFLELIAEGKSYNEIIDRALYG